MLRWRVFCIFVLSVAWMSAHSEVDAYHALKKQLDATQTLRTEFVETVYDEGGQIIQERRGEMVIKKPGKFRWVVRSPYTQYVVADGQYLWQYDPDLAQATVRNQTEAMSGTAAEILAGNTDTLARNFAITRKDDNGARVFVLHSRGDTGFERIDLYFHRQRLAKMMLYDPLGQKTRIVFDSVEVNVDVPDSLFFLSLPDGTEIVDSRDEPEAT